MPKKNSVKKYVSGGFYHLYNRGVNKTKIFLDNEDYGVFLKYLSALLSEVNHDQLNFQIKSMFLAKTTKSKLIREVKIKNFFKEIFLISYCLMPNHFHFLIKQNSKMSMASFLKSLSTRYVMYFNKKYKRVGPLFEGKYKGVLIKSSEQLLYVTKYIHRNPLEMSSIEGPLSKKKFKQPSSYKNFIELNSKTWLHPELIIDNVKKSARTSYKKFVEEEGSDPVK